MTRSEGLAHLDRLATRGAIASEVNGSYLEPRRGSAARALAWLGQFSALVFGLVAIGAGGFAIWGLVQ